MEPVHIICDKKDIAPFVIIAGDPKRTQYIASKYLKNYNLVCDIRGELIYTGFYNDKKITIATSGMGMPSMGIYSYELFNFYDVDTIIRVGTCGVLSNKIKVKDLIIAKASYSISTFNYAAFKETNHIAYANEELTNKLSSLYKGKGNVHTGYMYCSDVFDVYHDIDHILSEVKDIELLGSEMESFALFTVANHFGKKAACIATCTDSKFEPENFITSEEREDTLDDMIKLALSAI